MKAEVVENPMKRKVVSGNRDYMELLKIISYSYNYFKANERKIVGYNANTECPIRSTAEAVSIKKVLTQMSLIALARRAVEEDDIQRLFPEYEKGRHNPEDELKRIDSAEARIKDIFSMPGTKETLETMSVFMKTEIQKNNVFKERTQCL